jgi:hypothetical protein
MKRGIKHILTSLAAIAAFGSCGTSVVPDANVRYEYMFECLWTPDGHSSRQVEIPALFMDPGKPVCFTPGGNMAVLEKSGDTYRYSDGYSVMTDRGSDRMTISKAGESHYFVIDRVCETHMTLLYNGKETEYVTYRRSDLPEGSLDKGSFPDGWFR